MMSRHVFAFLPKYHPEAADGFFGSWAQEPQDMACMSL